MSGCVVGHVQSTCICSQSLPLPCCIPTGLPPYPPVPGVSSVPQPTSAARTAAQGSSALRARQAAAANPFTSHLAPTARFTIHMHEAAAPRVAEATITADDSSKNSRDAKPYRGSSQSGQASHHNTVDADSTATKNRWPPGQARPQGLPGAATGHTQPVVLIFGPEEESACEEAWRDHLLGSDDSPTATGGHTQGPHKSASVTSYPGSSVSKTDKGGGGWTTTHLKTLMLCAKVCCREAHAAFQSNPSQVCAIAHC